MFFTPAIITAILGFAAAHPGHDIQGEAHERREYLTTAKRADLSHCSAKLEARAVRNQALARRSALARRQAAGTPNITALDESHDRTSEGVNLDTPVGKIFQNGSCVLKPEVTEGPYYVVGEYIRKDLREEQKGVDLHLDVQVLDIETCEPIKDGFIEIWSANATGVYSGVVTESNGAAFADPGNIDKTWLRGIQPIGEDGTSQFNTLFPGHYTGRAIHVHTSVHLNVSSAAVRPGNGTLDKMTSSHIGQVYFDQDLISRVEAVEPYVSNAQALTTNSEDHLLAQENGADPFVQYALLGDTVADGVLGWITFGINVTSEHDVYNFGWLTEEGGVQNTVPCPDQDRCP